MTKNSQDVIFSSVIDEAIKLLHQFVSDIVEQKDLDIAKQRVISLLVDLYSQAYFDELTYILDQFDFDLNAQEFNNLQNAVNTSAFVRTNTARLNEILNRHIENIREYTNSNPEKSLGDIVDHFKSQMERVAVSEVQMGIERASVDSSVALQEIMEVPLYKTWNAVLDGRTCPTCTQLHGTKIPVTESFARVTNNPDIVEDLSYTGGETAYAHPHCRCWLTYSKA